MMRIQTSHLPALISDISQIKVVHRNNEPSPRKRFNRVSTFDERLNNEDDSRNPCLDFQNSA